MMELLKKQREDGEEGFTLIELMVVVLIIAILIAIAVPTFLGARQKAQDRGAQSNLRNSLTAAKTLYVDTNSYATITTTALNGVEPSLNHITGPATSTTSSNTVSTYAGGTAPSDFVVFAAYSKSGKCFFIKQIANAATTFSSADGTSCQAASGTVVTGSSW